MSDSSSDECGGFIPEKEVSTKNIIESSISLLFSSNNKCEYCDNSYLLDQEFLETFGLVVCQECRSQKFKVITKTKCIKDYLITTEEIEKFKHMVRPNPHKGTWSDMNLYLKEQIEEYAIKKWGSLEEIERIKLKRSKLLEERKIKKLKTKIRELQKKTRIKEIPKEKHRHDFKNINGVYKCVCGMEVEQEEF